MHTEILTEDQVAVLAGLKPLRRLRKFYLAGGTALGLEPVDRTPWGMKLEAIAGRGSRKDFIDLFVLSRAGLTLEEVFQLFDRKYGTGRTERYHRLRALSYFDDAEREPMPEMLVPIEWAQVREFFEREAARLLADGIHR
jgi:hypothetical protein